jgi:hypothetical protein
LHRFRRLRDWQFSQAITKHRKLYYVSAGRPLVLIYWDIDTHERWQTPEDGRLAVEIPDAAISRHFGSSMWFPSDRGWNGFTKISISRTVTNSPTAGWRRSRKFTSNCWQGNCHP